MKCPHFLRRSVLLIVALGVLASVQAREPRVDVFGDPLPERAVARFGSRRWLTRGAVSGVTWARDGKSVVAASRDEVVVFDVATGRRARLSANGERSFTCVAISPDGSTIAAGGNERVVDVWSVSSRSLVRTLECPASCSAVVFSPDGSRIAAGTLEGWAQIWDAVTGEVKGRFKQEMTAFTTVAFSEDGRWFAAATPGDGPITIRSASELDRPPIVCKGGGAGLGFSSDGATLWVCDLDCTLRSFSVPAGVRLSKTALEPGGLVSSVVFSHSAEHVALRCSSGEPTTIWRTATASLVAQRDDWDVPGFSPDETKVAVGGPCLSLFGIHSGTLLAGPPLGPRLGVMTVAVCSTELIATADQWREGPVRLWRADGVHIRALDAVPCSFFSIAPAPGGHELAVATVASGVQIFNVPGGEVTHTLDDPAWRVAAVSYSEDGARLACGYTNDRIRILDCSTWKIERTLRLPVGKAGVEAVAWSPRGHDLLAAICGDGNVRVYDTKRGDVVGVLNGPHKGCRAIAWSRDGKRLALVGWGGFDLWDVASETKLSGGRVSSGVVSIAFSPDGRKIATAGDRVVRVWDATTLEVLETFEGHEDPTTSVAFSADGKTLYSASEDATVLAWDLSR